MQPPPVPQAVALAVSRDSPLVAHGRLALDGTPASRRRRAVAPRSGAAAVLARFQRSGTRGLRAVFHPVRSATSRECGLELRPSTCVPDTSLRARTVSPVALTPARMPPDRQPQRFGILTDDVPAVAGAAGVPVPRVAVSLFTVPHRGPRHRGRPPRHPCRRHRPSTLRRYQSIRPGLLRGCAATRPRCGESRRRRRSRLPRRRPQRRLCRQCASGRRWCHYRSRRCERYCSSWIRWSCARWCAFARRCSAPHCCSSSSRWSSWLRRPCARRRSCALHWLLREPPELLRDPALRLRLPVEPALLLRLPPPLFRAALFFLAPTALARPAARSLVGFRPFLVHGACGCFLRAIDVHPALALRGLDRLGLPRALAACLDATWWHTPPSASAPRSRRQHGSNINATARVQLTEKPSRSDVLLGRRGLFDDGSAADVGLRLLKRLPYSASRTV